MPDNCSRFVCTFLKLQLQSDHKERMMKENRIWKKKGICGIWLLFLLCSVYGCAKHSDLPLQNEQTQQNENMSFSGEDSSEVEISEEKKTVTPKVFWPEEKTEVKEEVSKSKTEELSKPEVIQPEAEEKPKTEVTQPKAEESPKAEVQQPKAEEVPKMETSKPTAEESQKPAVSQPEKEEKPKAEEPPKEETKEETPSNENAVSDSPPDQLDMSQIGDIYVSAEEYDEKVSNSDVGVE